MNRKAVNRKAVNQESNQESAERPTKSRGWQPRGLKWLCCIGYIVCIEMVGGWSGVALAQESQPPVAPFPLELRRAPPGFGAKEREELQAELSRQLRNAGATVPNAAAMETALVALKRQDCDRENECLQKLAQLAQTLYGLYVSVDYDLAKNVVATARVVRDDGQLMGSLRTVTIRKGKDPFFAIAKVALVQVLEALQIKQLAPFREVKVVEDPPLATAEPSQPPPPMPPPALGGSLEPKAKLNTAQILGWTGAGVGGAALITGLLVFASAPTVRTDGTGNIYWQDAGNYKAAKSQQEVGVGLMIGGGVVAAAGATLAMVLNDTDSVKTSTSVVLMPGGAALIVGGAF